MSNVAQQIVYEFMRHLVLQNSCLWLTDFPCIYFQNFYWKLPPFFTGNRLSSYGGELRFFLRNGPTDISERRRDGQDHTLVELKVGMEF
jgi:hypothetical protein